MPDHGGAIETSMMLHLAGPHVDPHYTQLDQRTVDLLLQRKGIRPLQVGSVLELLRGFKHKMKYYETETYAGKPSIASATIGKQMMDVLAGHAAEALSEIWQGTLPVEECHSPLWPLRWVFTSRTLSWVFERAVGYRNQVF